MAIKSRSGLQTDNDTLFVSNGNQDITSPLHNEFNEDVLDSYYNKNDEITLVENQAYITTKSYKIADICVNNSRVLLCIGVTSGTFDATKWIDWDASPAEAAHVDLTHATNEIDLGGANQKHLILNGPGGIVTIARITNGVNGRRYRMILHPDITDLDLTPQSVATAIANGTGELAIDKNYVDNLNNTELKGNAVPVMADWFEFVYVNNGGSEYCSVYKIQKHNP